MISVTRRLILSVLLTEAAAGLVLITTLGFHEYHLQLSTFDTTLQSSAETLLGAVQDAEDVADNVMLDSGALHLPHNSVYRVQEDDGRVLATVGTPPVLEQGGHEPAFFDHRAARKTYRFVVLRGVRTIDPGRPDGGVTHRVIITYGMPFGRVRHEVVEAVRFSVLASAILLTATAIVTIFVMRCVLQPLHELASRAEQISPACWTFDAPQSAERTRELKPLADALSAALTRLKLSFTQQKRFISDAAHELKTRLRRDPKRAGKRCDRYCHLALPQSN